jgi:hypothetical protein
MGDDGRRRLQHAGGTAGGRGKVGHGEPIAVYGR